MQKKDLSIVIYREVDMTMFDGLQINMGSFRGFQKQKPNSVSAKTLGEERKRKGACYPWKNTAKEAARDLGTGWKVNIYCYTERIVFYHS